MWIREGSKDINQNNFKQIDMKNTILILLFAIGLLSSCSKSSPQPTCEEVGTEVTP